MQQNIIENKVNSEYALLAIIQQGAPIKFIGNSANDMYPDLTYSRLHMLVKFTNGDAINIAANMAALINL